MAKWSVIVSLLFLNDHSWFHDGSYSLIRVLIDQDHISVHAISVKTDSVIISFVMRFLVTL